VTVFIFEGDTMTRTITFTLVFMVVVSAATPVASVEAPSNDPPDLVLVLSGGGARGAAHIGVIRVLEELGIAPDMVVGTSMGAIIGGLYAAGWSPDDMEHLVREIDWENIFTDRMERRQRSFRRKQDDRPVMIHGRLHFDGFKPVLPSGVIDGQRLELMLRTIEALSPTAEDFDDLPIPYRAVAAEIATGEAVVIGSGSLAVAMRASMSVPGVLPPVEIDGRNLVDGGISANLPIGIARQLGAQRIIAVDISSPLLAEEDQGSGSFMSIYNRLNTLLTAGNRDRDVALLGPTDLLIVPDLGDISFVSFDRLQQTVALGEEAARRQVEQLRAFAASDRRRAEFARRERARPLEPIRVDRLRLENTSSVDDRLIRRALRISPPEAFDRDSLALDLLALSNTRYFGLVDFRIDEAEDGVHELVVETPPPDDSRGTVQLGIGILDDFDGGSTYHLLARHQYLPANRRGGEWVNVVQIGSVAGASTAFYQPLDWGTKWFVEPSMSFQRGTQELWVDGTALTDYQFSSWDARIAAGRVLGRWGEIRLAAFTGHDRGDPRIGFSFFPSVSEGRGGAEVRFRIDTEDSVVFPTSGANVDLRYSRSSESLGEDRRIERVSGAASYAWSFGKNTVVPHLEYGENIEPVQSYFAWFPVGGLFRLSGLGYRELLGEKAALARVLAYRRLFEFDLAGLAVRIYAGISLEAGNVYERDANITWESTRKGGSVFIGGETFIGPVIFAYGRTDGDRDRFYFAIGDRF